MSSSDSDITVVDPHGHLTGSTVGPWLILERLDAGAFGVVFVARRAGHSASERVALKMAKDPWDERFEREVKVLESSNHPAIPRFEDRGLWTGPKGRKYPYVVMELVEGFRLYDWFEAEPRSSREVLQVLAQLASALASAHARGIVHRDVKGDNIRVTSEGRAVLLDWGSCWIPASRSLTDTVTPPGTSAYRPPEQRGFIYRFRKDKEARWQSRPSDDLFSLGVTLYRMVTGSYLPPCTDGAGLAEREIPPPRDRATVALVLETLILRLTSDDRKARGTAEALAREVAALVELGEDLDVPIRSLGKGLHSTETPSSDGLDDEPVSGESDTAPSPPRFPRWRQAWQGGLAGAVVSLGLFLAFTAGVLVPRGEAPAQRIVLPEEVAKFTPDAGVGEEALQALQDVPGVVLGDVLSLGRPMPSKPYPEQRRAPCDSSFETTINGACWVMVGNRSPPCGDKLFDYQEACYLASFTGPKVPTSGTP